MIPLGSQVTAQDQTGQVRSNPDRLSFETMRQGDLLSPFLFNIIMETFSRLVTRFEEVGCLSGCQVGREGPTITLLQFANDSLVLLLNSEEEVCNLQDILLMYEAISKMKVNLHKSHLMVVGGVPNLERLANLLGCAMATTPGSYLGLPLGGRVRSEHVWDPVVERDSGRLATWKGHHLSKGGRLTLMKSALSSLPMYFMSRLHAPCSVIQMFRSFILLVEISFVYLLKRGVWG